MQERAGGVEYQVHVGQRGVQSGRVVQGNGPMRQVEPPGQRGDGRPAPAREQGPVTAPGAYRAIMAPV